MPIVMLAVFLALAQEPPAQTIDLDALTMAASTRPADCELPSSTSVATPDGRVRVALRSGLAIGSNPWKGTDRLTIAAILERLGGSSQVPDGPPPTARELVRYRMYGVDEVAEAYVAVYTAPSNDVTTVYGLRFKQAARAQDFAASIRSGFHVVSGDTVMLVAGGGSCRDALTAHVKSLIAGR